jgi:RecB family endonuclease NucS
MQSALRKNIEQLEKGLKIADDGKEHIVPSGRIDILAVDSKEAHVVIELKAGTADRDAVGQILSYIGDLQADGRHAIRGILVAADFTGWAIAASKAVPNVELRKYGFTFSFQKVKQIA